MAGTIKVDSINADSNLALKIANTAVAFIDATGLRPTSGNVNLDATATSKFYLPSANTVAIQTAGVTAVTVDSSQNVTLAAALAVTGAATLSSSLGVTGVTTVQAGTAALPAITTTGDTNTGIFFPAADTIAFTEGGAEAMRIASNSFVGIGRTSPNFKLHVTGNNSDAADNTIGMGYGRAANPTDAVHKISWASDDLRIEADTANTIASNITFTNDGTERARIDSSGNFMVGTTSSFSGGNVLGIMAQASGLPALGLNRTTSNGPIVRFYFASTEVGSIVVTGSTTSYGTSSDYRLKNAIAPMTGALAKVGLLKPVTYKWNLDNSESQGFIAHELQAVVPECVTGEKDAVETYTDEDGNEATRPVYQGIDTSFLVATLTAAIQELKAIVDAQATRIVALESK